MRLRAGGLEVTFVEGDLRRIRLNGAEVLSRVYMALRDRNWGTIRGDITNLQVEDSGRGFTITYDSAHRQGEIDFRWRATITGSQAGRISFRMDGRAHSDFWRNRIGLCVHHPMRECAGKACLIEDAEGRRQQSEFPDLIAPHQPFMNVSAMTYEVEPGVSLRVGFDGDVFETEDQRNWTDASFKTYSTPLGLPYPVLVKRGDVVRQRIGVTLLGTPAASVEEAAGVVRVTFPAGPAMDVPVLALALPDDGTRPSEEEMASLRRLRLNHVRVEEQAADANENFAELNRNRPDEARCDAVSFGVNPQVHVTDDETVMENTASQGDAVRSARAFFSKAVVVSPVRLCRRGSADPRQRQEFCAAWTVASLKALAEAGASSVTYFETHGAGGVVDGAVRYPVYRIFEILAGFEPEKVMPSVSSDWRRVAPLLLTAGARRLLLVANLTAEEQRVDAGTEVTLAPYGVEAMEWTEG